MMEPRAAGNAALVAITFVSHDGETQVVEAKVGLTVMRAARNANVPNIDAECGGACACATCQVFVDPDWFEATGEISDEEEALLDFSAQRRETSRLSCQIQVTEALDGLKVTVPESQF